MKRLVMYLVPFAVMVMLFLTLPGELLAEVDYTDVLELPWSASSQQDDIPYFEDDVPEAIDVFFDLMLRNFNSNGKSKGTIATDTHFNSWTAESGYDVRYYFHEDSTEGSYFKIEWDRTATYGESRLDLSITDYVE